MPARAAVGLQSFANIIDACGILHGFSCTHEFGDAFGVEAVEARNRRFVGITLLFLVGLTYIKILSIDSL